MENAQTIQQIKQGHTENLWEFLAQLPTSFDAQILYGLVLAGVIGMVTSFVIKWAQGQIEPCPLDYFFRDNPRGTTYSVIWLVGAAAGNVALGGYLLIPTDPTSFIGWGKVLFDGWILGTGGDLGLNKGKRPEWSPLDREASKRE